MQNRKDLLQAHRLMTQRAALALLQAEPDPPDRPLRRLNVAMFSGVLVAVIIGAIFGIWGIIDPGGNSGLTGAGTLITDSQSNTSYIWCLGGHKLCPMVNYASARLALGTNSPDQKVVSQAALAQYQRGPLLGIPGLPQPLPDSSMLVGSPWSVCVHSITTQATGQQTTVTTLVGGRSVGGTALSGHALVVRADGTDWVILNGERQKIPGGEQSRVLTALNYAQQQPETLPAAWVYAFPEGTPFIPPTIPGAGTTVTGPGGSAARVGQVDTTSVPGAPQQYYVQLSDGLAKITQTQAALLETVTGTPHSISPSLVAGHPSATHVPSGGLPSQLPKVISYGSTKPLCVVYTGTASVLSATPQVTVGGQVPSGGMPVTGSSGLTYLYLPPGTAALVGVVSSSQHQSSQTPVVSSYFLVTGAQRYGFSSPGVAGMLGYNENSQRTLLPAGVADLIPEGVAFDPANAKRQIKS